MSLFSPKEQFRKFHAEVAMELAQHAPSKWLTISLSTAMSQLGFQGATESELEGVRRFIGILLGLHEGTDEPVTFPKRELTSYDNEIRDKLLKAAETAPKK